MKQQLIMLIAACCAAAGTAAEDRTQTRIGFYSLHIVRVVKYLSSEKAQPEKKSFNFYVVYHIINMCNISDIVSL